MSVRNTLFASSMIVLAGFAAAPAAQAADVGVSIGFSQPGVYGRVDIGRYPQPVLVAPRPVIVGRPVYRDPVYLWVPPGHRRDWRHNCYRYNACGAQVYFVEDNWYRHNVNAHRGPDRRDDRHGRDWHDRHDRHDDHGHHGH